MKKVHLLSCAALLSLLVIAFSSCSKDALSENKAKNGQGSSNKSGLNAQTNDEMPGSIQAYIRPEYRSLLVYVYSDTYTSGDYSPNEDGVVTIADLAPGTYTLVLHHPSNITSDLAEATLTDIEVLSDEITYLQKVPL